MRYDDIQETGLYQSRRPDWSLSDTPETAEPVLGAYDYGQVDPYPGQGTLGADSSFLASPQSGNAQGVKDTPIPSWHQRLLTPTVKGNLGTSPLVMALHGLGNIIPQARPIIAANQAMFDRQYEQQQQQELLAERKKQAERQALHEGLQAINQATKIPAGSLRKAYLDSISKQYAKLTGDEDTGMFDLLKKASDEEFEALVGSLQEYATSNNLGIKDIRGLASNPALLKEVLSGSTERLKVQREAALSEQMLKDFSGSQEAPQGTPAAPTAPSTSPQPAPSQGAPTQLQGTSVGKGQISTSQQQIKQQIIDEARKQGLGDDDIRALLGIAYQESKFQNIDNSRRDPRDGVGVFQFVPSTGAQHGMASLPRRPDGSADPNDPRFNIQKNIQGGIALYKANKARTGSIDGAILAHNGGGDPQYLPKIKGRAGMFTDLGGVSRPSSTAVTTQATDAEQQAIQAQKQRIQEAQSRIDRLSKYVLAGNVGAQRTVTALQKEKEDAQKELGRLESTYNEKNKPDEMSLRAAKDLGIDKPYTQWTKQEREAVNAHRDQYEISFHAQKEKAALEATLPGKKELATAANQGNIITNPKEFRNTKSTGPGDLYPVGMTQADIQRENKETPGKWVPVVPVPEKQSASMQSNLEGINAAQRALKLLEDDNVARLVGHLFSNPEGSYKNALQKVFGNQKDREKYTELAAELSDLTSSIRHARIGGAQTVQETANLRPMLPSLDDVDAQTVRTKLRVLHNKLADSFNSSYRGGFKRGWDLHPEWQEVALMEAGQGGSATTAPEPSGPQESPLERELRLMRERREKKKKG